MTYNVFVGTLNLTQPNHKRVMFCSWESNCGLGIKNWQPEGQVLWLFLFLSEKVPLLNCLISWPVLCLISSFARFKFCCDCLCTFHNSWPCMCEQFNAFVTIVKEMISQVESEHRTKLEQLNSLQQENRSVICIVGYKSLRTFINATTAYFVSL